MLAAIRAFAKSWVAAVLMVLLIVSFALFGIRDVFNHTSMSDAVISAGPRTVTSADFKREFDNYKSQAEQQMGQPISAQVAADNGLDRKVLDALATREAFSVLLEKIGLRPSAKLVVSQIAKIPAFFNPVSGQFDKQQYQQRLGENGLTPAKFEGILRDELAEQHLAAGLANSMQVPQAYSAMAAIYALESRDVAFFAVDPSKVAPPAPPTDADLNGFIKQNAAQLTRPEFRQLTLVRFSPQMVPANQPVDPAKLQKLYDFRKDTLSTPETRTLVQIPAKDSATAQQVDARLARGEAPAAIAKSLGVDAITYDNKPQSAIADRKLGAAAFKMPAGQAAPVQGDLGMAVVKVLSVTPGRAVTLEEARPALEAQLRKDAAAEKVYALSQAYDDAHQKGGTLPEAAQKVGVPTVALGPVSKEGRDIQGQPVPGLNQKLMDTAFSLPAGGESDVVDAGGGEYFAVRVDKVIPPAVPSLNEIRPQLTRYWMMREMAKRMEARAEALAARVRKGESLEAVAASAGAQVAHTPALTRQTAGQTPGASQDLLGKVFNAKTGDVFTAQGTGFAFVVGKLEAVRPGDAATLAQMTAAARGQMTSTIFREIGDSARVSARNEVKVKVDYNRARTAIGLEPVAAPGQPEKAK